MHWVWSMTFLFIGFILRFTKGAYIEPYLDTLEIFYNFSFPLPFNHIDFLHFQFYESHNLYIPYDIILYSIQFYPNLPTWQAGLFLFLVLYDGNCKTILSVDFTCTSEVVWIQLYQPKKKRIIFGQRIKTETFEKKVWLVAFYFHSRLLQDGECASLEQCLGNSFYAQNEIICCHVRRYLKLCIKTRDQTRDPSEFDRIIFWRDRLKWTRSSAILCLQSAAWISSFGWQFSIAERTFGHGTIPTMDRHASYQ